ncbi:hypothetical protein BD413DRAFT_637711 [Trametes elegans]|nr:hypothetical protein BD413DRAFT_637711 [Trametes elegans]
MTETAALMLHVPPPCLPHEQPIPKAYCRPNIQAKARPAGPRRPRTQYDLNDTRLRRASAPVASACSKHSLLTPDVLPKPCRPATSSPSSTSASSSTESLSLPVNCPSPLVMTTTTTTMTFSPPARLRVSDSTPPFLLQQRHGPPAYFLHRMPPSTVPQSPAPSSHVKHKRSFPVVTLSAKAGLAEASSSTNQSQPRLQTSNSSANPDAPPTRRKASASPRVLPVPAPPPEKALPPIPFPSPPSSTPVSPPASARSLLLACSPLGPPLRPVSVDAEETICQLEQLAAELRQMGSGSPAAANERRSRPSGPAQRRRRVLPGAAAGGAKASLSVPRIVVTNPSTESLFGGVERETAGVRTPESDGDSGDVTEEELWVNEYGGWGTSEKGKWKAAGPEEDGRCAGPASCPHAARSGQTAPSTKPAEMFYIYEPIGAPEFLIGSSTSPVARATAGFHSPSAPAPAPAPSSSHQQCPSARRRRRRPAALVLANPEQAEWVAEPAAPKSAPLLARPAHAHAHARARAPSPPPMYRSLTAPQSSPASTDGFPSHPPPRRALSSDVVQAGGDMGADIRYVAPPSGHRSAALRGGGELPRVPSAHALRDEPRGGHARQAPSWDALTLASGPASEPNSPRLASRPRLKSIKGLFKHFSK